MGGKGGGSGKGLDEGNNGVKMYLTQGRRGGKRVIQEVTLV